MKNIRAWLIAGFLGGCALAWSVDYKLVGEVVGNETARPALPSSTIGTILDGEFVTRTSVYTHGDAAVDMSLYGPAFDVIQRSVDGTRVAARFISSDTTATVHIQGLALGATSVTGLSVNTLSGGAVQGVDASTSGFGVAGAGFLGVIGSQTQNGGAALQGYGSAFISGSRDEVQLRVEGNTTQTANLAEFRQDGAGVFDGTLVHAFSNAGKATHVDLRVTGAGGPAQYDFGRSNNASGDLIWEPASDIFADDESTSVTFPGGDVLYVVTEPYRHKTLHSEFDALANAGATRETLDSFEVAGGTVALNGEWLEIVASVRVAANGDNKRVYVWLDTGGGPLDIYDSTAQAQNDGTVNVKLRWNRSNADYVGYAYEVETTGALFNEEPNSLTATNTPGIWAADMTFGVDVECDAADDATLVEFTIIRHGAEGP